MPCRAPGCLREIVGTGKRYQNFGATYCATHRARERRNGDPNQITIKAHDVAPYLAQLDRRRLTYPDAPAWALLAARWQALVETSRGTIRARQGGLPMARWEHEAAAAIVRVADEARPEDAWRETVALFMLREDRPGLFVSDRAFLVQLSIRARKLAPSNRSAFGDATKGRQKRALRDPNIRSALVMGTLLRDTFGAAGMRFAAQERAEEERRTKERAAFHDALREVAPEGDRW